MGTEVNNGNILYGTLYCIYKMHLNMSSYLIL